MKEQMEEIWKQYPLTVDKAATEVISHLSEEEKTAVAKVPEDRLFMLHFNLGLFIRNKLRIGDYYARRTDRPLFDCADDESARVIKTIWERLHIRK